MSNITEINKKLDFKKYGFIEDKSIGEKQGEDTLNKVWFKYKEFEIYFNKITNYFVVYIYPGLPHYNEGSKLNYYWAFNAFFPEVSRLSKRFEKLKDKYGAKVINTNNDLEAWSNGLDEIADLLNKRNELIKDIETNRSLKLYRLQDYLFYIKKDKYQKLDSKNAHLKYLKEKTKLKLEIIELIPKE